MNAGAGAHGFVRGPHDPQRGGRREHASTRRLLLRPPRLEGRRVPRERAVATGMMAFPGLEAEAICFCMWTLEARRLV